MSNEVAIFEGQGFKVRTLRDEDGKVWFVARDVAEALEYSTATVNNALGTLFQAVPNIWAGKKRIFVRSENGVEQEREMLCLTEQGVYFFLGRSDKPKAIPYQIWIAGDVVPSIMHTGMYMTPKAKEDLISDPDLIIQLATEVKAQRVKNAELEAKNQALTVQNQALEVRTGQLESHNQKLEAKIETDKDKVAFAEVVEDCEDAILIGAFAKILYKKGYVTLGANRLFKWLRDHHILMSGGSQHNYPYQKYMDMGWFKVKEYIVNKIGDFAKVRATTLITGKGQRGVLKMLDELYTDSVESTLPLVFE